MNKTLISSIVISTLNVVPLALNAFLILQNLASWQSWTWLAVCILSILFSIIISLIILIGSNNRKNTLIVGSLSILPFITNVLACILLTDKVSWIDIKTEDTPIKTSLFIHCMLYDAEHNPTYPTLYNKCLFLDTTWLINFIASFIWLIMILYSFQTPSSYINDQLESKKRQSIFNKMKNSLHSSLSSKRTFNTASSNQFLDYTDFKTKKLPPLIDRSSDTTLCLPIHTKSYSSASIMEMKDEMPKLLQPTEEKLEVPDHLFIQINRKEFDDDDSIDEDDEKDVLTVVDISDYNNQENKINQVKEKLNDLVNDEVDEDDEDDEKDEMTVVNIDDDNKNYEEKDKIKNNNSINKNNQDKNDASSSARRLIVAKSCPNIKKNLLKMDNKKKVFDDSILKF
ncbi:unnamed protein product [Cunninghamella blakesleeana]